MDFHLFKPPGETVKLSKIELFKVNTYNFNIWEHTKKATTSWAWVGENVQKNFKFE